MPSGLLKKLALVGAFLVAVALLVGGEDDPGVIGQLGDAAPVEDTSSPAPRDARTGEAQSRQSGENDRSLSAWYAESEATGPAHPEPFKPAPIDHSHLISDAQPMVDTAPAPPPGAVPIAPVPAEGGE
ncbi:MAG: hypothetical protein AB3N06_03215 [Erythrobacter sp.]